MRLSTMPLPLPVMASALALALLLAAGAQPAAAQSRGELLYTTHCIACHNTQVHWRSKKQVVDWPSLRAQVRAWQATAQLAWTDDDIRLVASYLNDTYYRFPPPTEQRGDTARSTRISQAATVPVSSR